MSEYDTGNPVPSASMPDAWDNMQSIDKFVNSSEETITTRTGEQLDTLRGVNVKADNQLTQQQEDFETSQKERDAVVEEARQNLIPLSRQYMTLADAQADIANIPDGSATYVRSTDDRALADEYINNGGALEPTGRRMISKEYVDALVDAIYERIKPLQSSPDALFDIVSRNGLRLFKIDDDNGETSLSLIARLLTGDSGLNFSGNILDNNAPEGWLFLIYAKNGLVIAGVKEDGTKVGWGGSDSGGGQAGGITPGDTAVGYDDIRNYTGDATVRDVVGERIGGRFVVDASDTSSPDDGGGVLVGVDGRRWVRQCDFVSYDMFGAPRIPEDTYQSYALLSMQGNEASAQALLPTRRQLIRP
ncbi:hypothetical protein [Klebsiella pneumoniae]|uniref:hypothetical protein n=1 Tax=Klebsiella pneumoniae TaxID=573 RepID=UPI003890A72A